MSFELRFGAVLLYFDIFSAFRRLNRSIYYSVNIECKITGKNDEVVFLGNFHGENHLYIVYICKEHQFDDVIRFYAKKKV